MTHSSSRSAIRRPRSLRAELSLTAAAAMLLPLAALAQTAPDTKKDGSEPAPQQLPEVKTTAKAIDPNPNAQTGVPYKARTSAAVRHTRPRAETPPTIADITTTAIDESGVTDLKQILDAQPGITLGTGENGNAFGDRYIIRGQEARSDVFVDGLRDPGMSTRESFAIEQLEISKGPNSSFAGRGTVGGAVNAITKQATLDYDFTRASAAFGSDQHRRFTVDANTILSDELALRANLLHSYEDVPGRAPADRQRDGIALSATLEANKDLTVTLDYYGLRAKDKPDLGSYLVGTIPNRQPHKDTPVYAQDQDFLKSHVDTLTARFKVRLDDKRTVTSTTRYGTALNSYVTTGARGTSAYNADGSAYDTALLDNHTGWQNVEYVAHQTNLQWNETIAGMKHEFIIGGEFTDHSVLKGSYTLGNTGAYNCRTSTTAKANNSYCIYDNTGSVVSGLSNVIGRQITKGNWNGDWHIETLALSLMDTVDLTDRWTMFGGVRFDRFDFSLSTLSTAGVRADYTYSDTLTNSHLGVTYKLAPDAIVYASYASAADINGGESDTGTSSGYGGAVIYNGQIAGAKPERSRNLELGTKWEFFDHQLMATAALFQTTKAGVMEGANYDSIGTFNTGKNRVRGLELGLVGQLTESLTGQLGYTAMKSQVLASATASNIGHPLSNFANRSASVQLKYQLTDAFAFGGTAKHESDKCGGQPDTGAGYTNGLCSQPVPGYNTVDLFATYRFNKHLDTQINVLNVADKDYYTAVYRSGAYLYKGDGRAVRMTVNYAF